MCVSDTPGAITDLLGPPGEAELSGLVVLREDQEVLAQAKRDHGIGPVLENVQILCKASRVVEQRQRHGGAQKELTWHLPKGTMALAQFSRMPRYSARLAG